MATKAKKAATKLPTEEFANPNQAYWDKALDCLNQGFTNVQAIQAVWQIMQPPALLSTLATIIGAIYADSYWSVTKLDPALLSSSLQAAGGWNKVDCDKAAQIAFQRWYGLLVRANFQDASYIPKPDPVTASPDVVVNGQATLSVQQLVTMWNQYIYTPVLGMKNNTYGRAQSMNIQVPINQAVLRMFYSDAGFNPPPQSWIQMLTFDDSSTTSPLQGVQAGPIGVGARVANTKSFGFVPPGTGHYCLIAVAGTEYFANNPLDTPGNWNSQEWVHYNGAAGWHNVDVTKSYEEALKFYNQDARPERFIFEAHCLRVPEGTIVSLECNNNDLAYPINSGGVKITRDYQVVSTEAEVPPNFAGELTVQFKTPNGKLLPGGSSVDVQMHWLLPYGHTHYVQALDQLADVRSGTLGHPVRIAMGNFTFLGEG